MVSEEKASPTVDEVSKRPRWSREETVVLIEGRREAEKREVEGKWEWVSWYCKRQGVKREAVQCRKRWSNLVGDYNRIKEWESHQTESFWAIRNEVRRERKLPGFFDKEVFDVLDGVNVCDEAVFDSGRRSDGLFDDDDDDHIPVSGTPNDVQPPEMASASHDDRKRKRVTTEGEDHSMSTQNHLLEVVENNAKMLTAQIQAQDTNFQLDRQQRKDDADTLVSVLDKLANALAKIADKL